MTKRELNKRYFNWMLKLVYDDRYSKGVSYRKLLGYLHTIDFTYTIPLDDNRYDDGIELRYTFGYEEGYEDALIFELLDDRPCSVLEMMVALALRCETQIMGDPDYGDRTGQWFWEMIRNLGLAKMDDSRFDEGEVEYVINNFLEHRYSVDGVGGLFTVPYGTHNMRDAEIWAQLNWYLAEYYPVSL